MNEKNKNLTLRLASAAVLLPTVIWITSLGGLPFAGLCAVVAAICAGELIHMSQGRIDFGGWVGAVIAGLIPLAAWRSLTTTGALMPEWFAIALGGATILIMAIYLFKSGPIETAPRAISIVTLGWLYSGLLLSTLTALNIRYGTGLVLLSLSMTWMNDTWAYFGGRFFGKHKLFEQISPKKTWEGFLFGIAGSVAGAYLAKWLWVDITHRECFIAGLPAAFLGPLGDLAESMLKRSFGVKDSGKVIPGHGGVLDRIDAALFVAPWTYFFAAYLR